MTAAEILFDLRQHGAEVVLTADAVRLRITSEIPEPLLASARDHKAELRALVERETNDAFNERAAIAELDGGLSREHAETLAALCTMPTPVGLTCEQMNTVIDAAGLSLDRQRRPARQSDVSCSAPLDHHAPARATPSTSQEQP